MLQALSSAIALIFSGDHILYQIIGVTLEMTLCSSLLALLFGVPVGSWLGISVFRGRKILVIIDRALMGLPPVVCGLFCYLLFSGVGPLRGLKLLYTVAGMVIAQFILLFPMAVGMMETYTNGIAGPIRETSFGLGLRRGRMLSLRSTKAATILFPPIFFFLDGQWQKLARSRS